ncbi:uncharacterized protein LOC143875924 [Tasmannia lanceolata]|uniref:uncharacterized protein LOC143875924 n=1 Tax=Tasmannia lanceolata TaxID=3420 RepID=UPI004063E290
MMQKQSDLDQDEYQTSLNASVDWKARENPKLTAPDIQKDIAHAATVEMTNIIINDLGIIRYHLVDESRDLLTKEQVVVVLYYVDQRGRVIEYFLGITFVADTTAITLKATIELMLSKYGLSIARLCGQEYDGTSNIRVAVAKNHLKVASFFNLVTSVFNMVGALCKRRDIRREKITAEIIEVLTNNEFSSGRGLNQETSLRRSGDKRWSSHYDSLISLIVLFSSVTDVIEIVKEDGLNISEI